MKVLVFSDSHGHTDRMTGIINRTDEIGLIIHLGDVVKDAEEIQYMFKDIKVEYVAGNNDWFSGVPGEKTIHINGKKVLITHGNSYGVKNGYERIIERGQELGVDIVLFGHTHIPYENHHNNIMLINPGSISLPAAGKQPSYCILEVSEQKIRSKIHAF